MTDSTNQTATDSKAEKAAPKPKTVTEDMPARRVFDSTEDAAAYLNTCAETYSDFDKLPLASRGLDDQGDFDPAVYTDGMRVMVAKLSEKGKGAKAIVIAPIPSLEMVLADEAAKSWLIDKVLNKELNHIAVRNLRDADNVETVADQIPTTLAAYISSAREAGGIMDTFNSQFKGLNEALAKRFPVWGKARLTKADFKRALESSAYASAYYPALEDRGEGKDSLFVTCLQLGISVAKKKGLDPTIFERWTDTRDAKPYTPDAEEDEDELDLDALTSELMEDEAKDAAKSKDQPTAE